MARGFGSTLGAGTTDSITLASFTMPSKISVWVRYLKNGTGGSGFGRIFEKPGPSTKEITLAISSTTKLFIERDFSTTNGVWEFDDPQANTVGLWADVFFTYDDSSTSNVPLVWVNGRPVTVTTSTIPVGTAVNTSGVCHIGNRADSARNWDGIISKFAMWSVALGYGEAKALLAGGDPLCIKPNSLIDYVDLSTPFIVSQKYHSALAFTGTKIRGDRIIIPEATRFPFASASAAQSITPSLFTNTNTFFAPTVSAGAVGLTPGLFTNSNSFPAPTVLSSCDLAPGLFSNSNTFFAPTVSPGAVNLAPSLFTNSNTFYAPTVSLDGATQDLTPSLFSNTNSFFAPTVSASYTLTVPLVSNSNSFFSPTVQVTYELIASLFGNTNSFFGPSITTGAVDISPSLFTNSNVFYAPIVLLEGQQSTRRTGLRPTSRASRLRTNLSTGSRPAAVSRG